ncbi:MAG: DUF4864 domain-containing protein [Chlamydiales bacterium]|nr:DUF4864 domain-containing protein [Chlamydiales bacterium]
MPPLKVALISCCALLACNVYGQVQTDNIQFKSEEKKVEDEVSREINRVIDSFLTAIRQGAASQAYYAYTSFEFRQTTPFKNFKDFLERYPSIGRNRDVVVISVPHFDNLGTLTGYATSTDGYENVVSFDVIYEVQKWRILGIQVYSKRPPLDE